MSEDPLLLRANLVDLNRTPWFIRFGSWIVRRLPKGRYRLMNWFARYGHRAFWTQTSPRMGGFYFLCDLRDGIAREVCLTDRYEPQETMLIQTILRPGMTFVDVGANWGYFTLLAASRVGPKGVVLSLEPHPFLHERLIQNIQQNQFKQVRAFPYAASNRREMLQFASFDHHQDNWGTSRIVSDNESKTSCINVQGIPLDELLRENQISHVDLMKMDIEGAEGFALAGLEGMIRERRISRLILELHPKHIIQHNQSVEQILQLLIESGYTGWTIDHSKPSTRRAAYKKEFDIRDYLFPFSLDRVLDDWPHTVWTAKGEFSVVEPNR